MKRSEINARIRQTDEFFKTHQFYLPPFAHWSPDEWTQKGPEVQRIVVQTKLLGWSNWWLYRYYDKLSQARSSSQRPDGSEPRHAYGT